MTLIPERFLRFAIRDLQEKDDTEEHRFWLGRLKEYYAINHGDLQENAAVDAEQFKREIGKSMKALYEVLIIDLNELLPEDFILVGFDNGVEVRDDLSLEREDWHQSVHVSFPHRASTISYSFFKGLLGPSVMKCGTSEKFFERYTMVAPAHLQDVLRMYVHRILVNPL